MLATAVEASTRVVHGDPGARHAAALFERYRRLFVGAGIVAAILELERGRPGAAEAFERRRRRWELHGGFLETITLNDVRRWIASDDHIVVEAAVGSASAAGAFRPVAQSVLRLPGDGWAWPSLGGPRDEIFDPDAYERVQHDGRDACALSDYLGVLPQCAHTGLAGAARASAIAELTRRNASRAPTRRIRNIVGFIFAVHGVELLEEHDRRRYGDVLSLADLGQPEIINRASLRAVTDSARSPARSVGIWRHAPPLPVALDGRRYRLLVHWHCIARRLRAASPASRKRPASS